MIMTSSTTTTTSSTRSALQTLMYRTVLTLVNTLRSSNGSCPGRSSRSRVQCRCGRPQHGGGGAHVAVVGLVKGGRGDGVVLRRGAAAGHVAHGLVRGRAVAFVAGVLVVAEGGHGADVARVRGVGSGVIADWG